MSASAPIVEAFMRWHAAEVAAIRAAPCPDDTMNDLVDEIYGAWAQLTGTPATNADDVLLKVFPALLSAFPARGLPLVPTARESSPDSEQIMVAMMVADLAAISPALLSVMRSDEG